MKFFKMRANKNKRDRQLLATSLLLVGLAVVLLAFFLQFYNLERQACVTRLWEHTDTAGREVLQAVDRIQTYLEKIAPGIYYQYREIDEDKATGSEVNVENALRDFGHYDMIARLELFLPDGTLYTADGPQRDPTLSYHALVRQGTGATRRSLDQLEPNQQIIRLFMPVRDAQGRTEAMLCAVIPMDRLAACFPVNAYDGQARLYLMESETGNHLIDPDHEKPGNLRDVESYLFTRGYSKEQFFREVRTGRSGVTIMRSPSSNSSDYFCYTSVGFQDWVVMLSVKEDLAFAQSTTVFWLFIIMIILVVSAFSIFMLWFFRDVRRRQARTALQLQGGQYMLRVQQTLFRAHIDPEAFEQALWIVANYLAADAVAYYGLTEDGNLILDRVGGAATKIPPKRAALQAFFPQTVDLVLKEGCFMGNRPFLWGDEDARSARELGIRGMMWVRLNTLDGKRPLGMLVAVNPAVLWNDTQPLDQIALTFTMAVENRENYKTLAYISQVDDLTGLMNRSSYHIRMDELAEMEGGTVGCVYIDANGLHEINNHLGHDAGDEMLRSVADALLESFNKKDTFRLGGDEFAVLVTAMPQEELEQKAKKVRESVEKCGYTVSVGLEWKRGQFQIQSIVSSAEAAMRADKAKFYASQGGKRQMRNLNTHLEQTLAAKRDADTLLSYLVPHLRGVYFVDPKKDSCRFIVALPDFEELLEEGKFSFRSAMTLYIQRHVDPDDQARLLSCCDYDSLLSRLEGTESLELRYRRTDGTPSLLQIRYPRRKGDSTNELIWLISSNFGL